MERMEPRGADMRRAHGFVAGAARTGGADAGEVSSMQHAGGDAARPVVAPPSALAPATGGVSATPGKGAGAAAEASLMFRRSAAALATAAGFNAARSAYRPEAQTRRVGAIRFAHRGDGLPLPDDDTTLAAALAPGAPVHATGALLFRVELEDGGRADLSLQQLLAEALSAPNLISGRAPLERRLAGLIAAARAPRSRAPAPVARAAAPVPLALADVEMQPDDDDVEGVAAAGHDAGPPTRKYCGVTWSASHGSWHVRVRNCHRNEHMGYFHDQEEAARAWDARKRAIGGTEMNFPDASRGETLAVIGSGSNTRRERFGQAGGPARAARVKRPAEAEDVPYYRGVWRSSGGTYGASISHGHCEKRYLGSFRSAADAARAWDAAARKLGRTELNFPKRLGETRVSRGNVQKGPAPPPCKRPAAAAAAPTPTPPADVTPTPSAGAAPEWPPQQQMQAATAAGALFGAKPAPAAAAPMPPPTAAPPPPKPQPPMPAAAAAPAPAPAAPVAAPAAPAAFAAPLSALEFVRAIRPALVDADNVAALLVAADYATVEQLAVLRSGDPAERHAELELLGVRSPFNRSSLMRAINALPPPPPPPM